jgi:hypothetical protein
LGESQISDAGAAPLKPRYLTHTSLKYISFLHRGRLGTMLE